LSHEPPLPLLENLDGNVGTDLSAERATGAGVQGWRNCRGIPLKIGLLRQLHDPPGTGNGTQATSFTAQFIYFYLSHSMLSSATRILSLALQTIKKLSPESMI
jgi:hypothetical protein